MLQNKSNKQIQLIPTKFPHVYDVVLHLDFQTRHIGKLDTSGEGTFLTNRKEKHLFRKTNSLGINYSLIADESIHFKWIVIIYCGRSLFTTREYFLKKGKALQFSNKNFELQLFVPITELSRNIAERFKKSTGRQEDLFETII